MLAITEERVRKTGAYRRGPYHSTPTVRKEALSPRECEVLYFIVMEGQTNKKIAERLRVSTKTVESQRNRLMQKTHNDSLAGLCRWFWQLYWRHAERLEELLQYAPDSIQQKF